MPNPFKQFEECPWKVEGQKYIQLFDGICYDCHIENKEIFHRCEVHFITQRIGAVE